MNRDVAGWVQPCWKRKKSLWKSHKMLVAFSHLYPRNKVEIPSYHYEYQTTEVRLKQSILIFNGVAYFITMNCFCRTRLILIFIGRHKAQKAYNIVVLIFLLIYVIVLKTSLSENLNHVYKLTSQLLTDK